jgi:hypothetical protein
MFLFELLLQNDLQTTTTCNNGQNLWVQMVVVLHRFYCTLKSIQLACRKKLLESQVVTIDHKKIGLFKGPQPLAETSDNFFS